MAVTDETLDAVTYEALAELERDFDEIDNEVLRHQYHLSKNLYAKRSATIAKIPKFWALALEQVPDEISRYIQPSDSEIFAECLLNIEVDRFEISDSDGKASNGSSAGDPRSLRFRFDFSPNDWFEDTVLEKKFWWRRSDDGWTGLVSEPVRIHWKRGKDPTKGLMDGALALWQARQAAGDMRKRDLPEFDSMTKITETWNGENTSFFTWFAFVSARRWVSSDESAEAVQRESDRRKRAKEGKETSPVPSPDIEQLERQAEAHDDGDGLASVIAEDFWPGAIRYFTQAQENNDLTDDDFEEDGDEDEDDDEGPRMENVDLAGMVTGEAADADSGADSDADRPPKKRRR